MEKVAVSSDSESGDQLSYRAAGVDTSKQDAALGSLLQRLRGTWSYGTRPQLEFGHFANIVALGPINVAISTDGIGTKALVAQLLDKYDTVGIDCVAVNANDVLCVGAVPQSMVDYIAVEKVIPSVLDDIGKGLAEGARQAKITIVGGEIAQLPEVIRGEGDGIGFDLAGTCIGTLDSDSAITGVKISPGDVIIGLRSTGVHSNGLTLARRVFGATGDRPLRERRRILSQYYDELGSTLGEELLKPTRIYVAEVMSMLSGGINIRGLAHITGDGFLNLPRLQASVGYVIDNLPEPPPIFNLIQREGKLPDVEMYQVFNMGIGLCIIVPEADASAAHEIAGSHGVDAFTIGYVVEDLDRRVEIVQLRLRGWRKKGFQPVL